MGGKANFLKYFSSKQLNVKGLYLNIVCMGGRRGS
jgi:hypothetical protein